MAFWGILSNNIRLFLYSANKLTEMKKLLVICAFSIFGRDRAKCPNCLLRKV
jgi:hypothetical protein